MTEEVELQVSNLGSIELVMLEFLHSTATLQRTDGMKSGNFLNLLIYKVNTHTEQDSVVFICIERGYLRPWWWCR